MKMKGATVEIRKEVDTIVVRKGEFVQVHIGGGLIEAHYGEGGPTVYVRDIGILPFCKHPAHKDTPKAYWEEGDTVQIHQDARVNPQLRGMQATVTEVKAWGVCADVPVASGGVCPVRLEWGNFSDV